MSDPVRGGPSCDVRTPASAPESGGEYMLIPVGEDVSVPVTVVLLGAEPDVTAGELKRLDWDVFRLGLTKGPSPRALPPPGTRLIVTVGDRTKLAGRVLSIEEEILVVSRDPIHASDDRAAPRVMAVLTVRWRVDDGHAKQWLAGSPEPGPFASFRGTADVSMSGIRFVCPAVVPIGAQLLLELELGPFSDGSGAGSSASLTQKHRVIGIVRRVETLDGRAVPGGIEPRHAIGVEFLDISEAVLDALSDFTLENL